VTKQAFSIFRHRTPAKIAAVNALNLFDQLLQAAAFKSEERWYFGAPPVPHLQLSGKAKFSMNIDPMM
jgi:hypothetical protein